MLTSHEHLFMVFNGMGQFLESLRAGSKAHAFATTDDGYSLIRRHGQEDGFNVLARQVLDRSGHEYVAFPTTDGGTGYERIFLLPLDH